MRYVSTRNPQSATTLSAAISAGLAADGGLYVPQTLPRIEPSTLDAKADLATLGSRLLAPFFAGDPLQAELPAICTEAFDFEAPLRALPFADAELLELFHGPTAAFKDFGARFLAACLRRLHAGHERPLTILVATSGDTGAAVAAAFHGMAGIRVCILYPDGRVSPRQAHQLGCFGDNVHALRVAGSFDDCQRMVKQALGDTGLQARVPMSSANSISLGRLLPQMVYHTQAALRHQRQYGTAANFIVPSGNLGNALACIWAREMGMPIGRVHFAANANATIPEFFAGGDYRERASVATPANAMDVGAPSNFERLRWMWPDDEALRAAFSAGRVDDEAIRRTLADCAREHDEVLCPHTATAVHELLRLRDAGDRGRWIVVATAHPAKFDRVVEPLVGHRVPLPPLLQALLQRPAHAEPLAADDAALHRYLLR